MEQLYINYELHLLNSLLSGEKLPWLPKWKYADELKKGFKIIFVDFNRNQKIMPHNDIVIQIIRMLCFTVLNNILDTQYICICIYIHI